jgi:hypothetical protein
MRDLVAVARRSRSRTNNTRFFAWLFLAIGASGEKIEGLAPLPGTMVAGVPPDVILLTKPNLPAN